MINIIVGVIIFVFLYFIIPSIEFSKQLLLLDSLKQISSIVLAITGAWAAIIYPDSLKKLIQNVKDTQTNIESIKRLIKPMIMSIIILMFILAIEIIGFSLKLYINNFVEYIDYLRKISLSCILFLYILQIYSLISTIVPILDAYNKATNEHKKNGIIQDATSNTIEVDEKKKKKKR